ncbi:YgaP family membrane protein [Desulfobacter sp.]|uniref:YgaP family membrane protein n=1 Tax=Desulfobacter sp. TaxID=2294 RepID=UPI003D0F8B69
MKMEHYIRAIAGSMILITLILAWLVSPYWLLFTAFVGINLVQSAFTGFCPMENILEKVFKVPR